MLCSVSPVVTKPALITSVASVATRMVGSFFGKYGVLLTAARELQELSSDGEYINYWQTPWAEVRTEEAIPVNLDGEAMQFSNVRYEAVPGAIRLIVPPNCPLLSAQP